MSAISREEEAAFWHPLAYTLGVWLGDGSHTYNTVRRDYSISFVSMDEEIIVEVNRVLSSHFNFVNPGLYDRERTKAGTPLYRMKAYSKILTELFCWNTDFKGKLPDFIWNAPKEVQLEMLAGLMDTDGTIAISGSGPKYWVLRFSGTKGFAYQVPDLCRVIGINMVGKGHVEEHLNPAHAQRLIVSIPLRSALANGFYFKCARKAERLERARVGLKPSETICLDAKA